MATYSFLSDNRLTLQSVWQWAKRLVETLNRQDARISTGFSVPTGAEMAWSGATAPLGWLLCNGGSYSVELYPELFNQIGYTFGGAGASFNVPDRRNRLLMGAGSTVGLNATAGASTVTIATANLPAHNHPVNDPQHTHTFTGSPHNHTITDPGHVHAGGVVAGTTGAVSTGVANVVSGNTGSATTGITVDNTTMVGTNGNAATGVTVGNTGGGTALSVLNPVVGVNMIIKA